MAAARAPLFQLSCAAAFVAALPLCPAAAQEGWKPVEREEFYAVAGRTAFALYESIGVRGPKAGVGRAIAFTDFKLTWTRDYQERGGTCTLASAKPRLVVTTRLPKPAGKLPPPLQARWNAFIGGVRAHETTHGRFIVEMVEAIRTASVGLTASSDPGCRKVRAELTKRLAALSAAQRQRSRDFDRAELSEGGNVHRLILRFVNGEAPGAGGG